MAIAEWWLADWLPDGGDVFVDVGANRGTWSATLAGRFRQVYAMEPNPGLVQQLNGVAPNVFVLPLGAWSSSGAREFTVYGSDEHLSTVFATAEEAIGAGAPTGRLRLWCARMDELAIAGHVDLMKVDVEGAELEALRGAMELVLLHRPLLIVEVHTEENGETLQRVLRGWGYDVAVVRHPEYPEGGALWARHYWLAATAR